jgi:hypothetical protein
VPFLTSGRLAGNPAASAEGGDYGRLGRLRRLPRGQLVTYGRPSALGLQLGADDPLVLEAVGAQRERLAAKEAAAVEHRHDRKFTVF